MVCGAQELEGCSMEALRKRAAENGLELPSELESDDEHFDPSPDTVADDDKADQSLAMRAWDAVRTSASWLASLHTYAPLLD